MKIEKQNPGFAKRVKSWLTGKYVENGSTASQNIPAGKWVTWKGQVCYAKTAITAGDTLSDQNLGTDDEGMINDVGGKWQLIGTISDRASDLQIPTSAKEVLLLTYFSNTSPKLGWTDYIPVAVLTEDKSIRHGYYVNSGQNAFSDVNIYYSTMKINMREANGSQLNGSSVQVTVTAYYR